MTTVLSIDPGNSSGWIFRDKEGNITGGTIYMNPVILEDLFKTLKPDIVIYETFQLFAGAAKHLVHDDFYVIQVIGMIRLLCIQYKVPEMVPQAPSIKRFSGGVDARWKTIPKHEGITEHTKDSYMHLRFFERFSEKKKP